MIAASEATVSGKPREFRGYIYNSIIETIGATPLVRVKKLAVEAGCVAEVLGKCGFFNPLHSVRDRIGLAMIEAAEAAGQISPGTVLVEPTFGNTGIALAFVYAAQGYRLILTMLESVSLERRKMLHLLGAEIESPPRPPRGMTGAIQRAEKLVASLSSAVMLQQFDNPANPVVHLRTTAEEIWCDTSGQVDVVVSSGVGTGGTHRYRPGARRPNPASPPPAHGSAVEPEDSAVLSGDAPGPHKI